MGHELCAYIALYDPVSFWICKLAIVWITQEKNCRKGRFSPSKLKGKRVIELGAGCGVAGFGELLLLFFNFTWVSSRYRLGIRRFILHVCVFLPFWDLNGSTVLKFIRRALHSMTLASFFRHGIAGMWCNFNRPNWGFAITNEKCWT